MTDKTLPRVFVAVPVPHEVHLAIDRWRSGLGDFPKPVPVGNFHITLRFIGPVDPVGLDRLTAGLDQAELPEPFTVRLGSLGAFPKLGKAEVAWLGVEDTTGRLSELAAGVEESVRAAGLSGQERPFRGHITLARLRPPRDLRAWDGNPRLGIKVPVRQIVLYQSHLGEGPARYQPLEAFPL